MDRLRALTYFVAVAEERHFGRAAERLHMAQPPLSQAIIRLEREVGAQLFARTTRQVDLTPAGAAYLPRAREILRAVGAADEQARRIAAGREGRLVIGCVGSVTYSLLPSLVRALQARLPEVDVDIRVEMLNHLLVESLDVGAVDLAVMRPPVPEPLHSAWLRADRLVAAVPRDDPLAAQDEVRLEDLATRPFVVHGPGSAMGGVVQLLFTEQGLHPLVAHSVGESSTVATLVAAGLGVAVVPEAMRSLALDGMRYVPLAEVRPSIDLLAAWAHPSSLVDNTLAVLTELVGE